MQRLLGANKMDDKSYNECMKGLLHKDKSQCNSPFFLHSRRKDVENQRQTSKMLKTQVAEADPSDFLVSLEESVFSIFRKSKFQVGLWLEEMLFL